MTEEPIAPGPPPYDDSASEPGPLTNPPAEEPEGEPNDEATWQRLDKRMLLIGPVRAIREVALPLIIAVIGLSATSDQTPFGYAAGGATLLLFVGVLPWLTTRFRLTESQFQVRSGLVNKKRLTAPLDRVRSVDLTANVLHRALGLAKVEIGTGVDAQRIELDALSRAQAEELATVLRQRSAAARGRVASPQAESAGAAAGESSSDSPYADAQTSNESLDTLVTLDWSWLRFAPLSLSRLVLVFGALGALSQFVNTNAIFNAVEDGYRALAALGVAVAISLIAIGALLAWVLVAVSGYVLAWASLRLAADHHTIRLTAGLLTTRSITLEQAKVRGVVLDEPVLLRLAHGAQLSALATGVGLGCTTQLLPPAPAAVCREVAAEVLQRSAPGVVTGSPLDDPLTVPLVPHGRAAWRRCLVRAQLAHVFVYGPLAALAWWRDWSWAFDILVVVAVVAWGLVVGHFSYRHLGHALTDQHVVSGDGLLTRRRTVIEREGILGWVVTQNIFQRRAGLATLVAPIAAGSESVTIRDLPLVTAFALADTATPRLLDPFHEAPAPVPAG